VSPTDPAALGRHDPWDGVHAVVAGFGAAGFAAADNLTHLGARVTALGETADGRAEEAELLEVLGATVRLGAGATTALPDDADVLVASPGWDESPLVRQARGRGLPVWGEVDLAWRLRDPEHPAPWLCVAGARDTTRVVGMLEAVLHAAGLRTVAAGAAGLPVVEVVMDPEPYDVLAVGLTADQLRGAGALAATSAAVLDVGAAAADLGRVYEQVRDACVYLTADPATEALVRDADVVEGARAVGVTTGVPAVAMLGVVEELLVDRAFIAERTTSAAELCAVDDLPDTTPETLTDALVAAALARAHGVGQVAVRDGLRAFTTRG
jgi:UDP-N-acetylmuramoylalanine--D-glutamate ligase